MGLCRSPYRKRAPKRQLIPRQPAARQDIAMNQSEELHLGLGLGTPGQTCGSDLRPPTAFNPFQHPSRSPRLRRSSTHLRQRTMETIPGPYAVTSMTHWANSSPFRFRGFQAWRSNKRSSMRWGSSLSTSNSRRMREACCSRLSATVRAEPEKLLSKSKFDGVIWSRCEDAERYHHRKLRQLKP